MGKSPMDSSYTEKELLEMKRKEAIEGLNESQQRFCEEYVRTYNVQIACAKAGYKQGIVGYSLLKKEAIRKYICWLKVRILSNTMVDAKALIDHHLRIAFADITDFVDIRYNSIRIKPSEMIDGQLVKSIKSTKDGVAIELYDKMKSLDFLSRYCEDMPMEWKQKIEERRMELQEKEFELKKKMCDDFPDGKEDDGFIGAIKKAAKIIWENEGSK